MCKLFQKLSIVILGLVCLGGCMNSDNKVTITKQQQNNIATQILRVYAIDEIEFIDFKKDSNTGFYYLVFKLNNDEEKRTGISIANIKELDEIYGTTHLSPTGIFDEYKRKTQLSDTDYVDLTKIKIKYMGE